jgi:uncharacterized protein YjdB
VVNRLRRATLGEFEIGHELGRGGMAAVFLAHELSLHRDVAIKVMSPGLLMGDGMIDRFRREAITIAHLNHPNIVSVYSVRAVEGLHFFVMRCIQGRSLEHVIRDAGRLPVPMVRSILQHVGSALAYAHRFKVVHRDIKPANILIDDEGNAVVTDFGIAKATEGPSQTHSGFMVGTPAYMSPEQCAGGEISGASDQYSLGAVAYEMITGTPPFTGSTYSVIQAHVELPPRPIRDHCDYCPPELEAAVLRMLAKNPQDRWPGMQQALTALGATALAEDDPLRAELSRFAMAGARTTFASAGSSGRGGKTSAVLQVTPPGMMRAITILPPPPGLEVGDSFLLVARVHDGHAARLPSGPVEWSSDAPGVLRVNASKAVATAITPGSALIRAVCDGNEGRLRVTVAPPRADAIVVKPLDKPITVGDEVRLEATPRDKRGRVVTRPVTWRSDDDAVATVSLEGVLVARSGGTTQITAELDEARSSVEVSVLPPRVAAVHISEAPESVVTGDSFQLMATPLDRWAGPLTERTVAWNVSDVNVAIVTAAGWVIARNPGLVVLTAVCEGVSASISVNVVDRTVEPVESVLAPSPDRQSRQEPWELPPDARSPEPRRQRPRPGWLVATGGVFLVAGGFWLAGGRRPLESLPPAESAVALRDTTPAEIPATPAASVPVPDTTTPVAVTITERPARPLEVGSSSQLAVEVRDRGGRVVPDAAVIWSSTDSTVLSVDSATGSVQAVGRGRAQVIASAGELRDTARIVVRAVSRTEPVAPRVPASLSIQTRAPLKVGDTLTLSVRALDQQGAPIRGARVSWSSSEPNVAAVNPNTGRVRAYTPGNTVIIARSGEESAITSLSVLPPDVSSVAIQGAAPLKVGDTLDLTAEPRDRFGRPIAERQAVWSSSSPEVAAVDSASGIVVAAAPGSTEITATVDGKSVSRRLTVLKQPRTSRVEPVGELAAQTAGNAPAPDPAAERQRIVEQMLAGVERCYGALQRKDVAQVHELYKPVTKDDREKLRKLARILYTKEWEASVGARIDGDQRVDESSAAMDFGFRMTWKDAFGGRLSSQPVFRAEFARNGGSLVMSSCRIINSPKL